MRVKDIMTTNPSCCTPETDLVTAAQIMCHQDCGEVPVIESESNPRPIGVITDRDITCRTLGYGRNPMEMNVEHVMSQPCVTVQPNTTLEECLSVLEYHRIRRVPVIDEKKHICGIVAQADIARHAPADESAELLHEVSEASA